MPTSTSLHDLDAIEQSIREMRNLIDEQLACYEKIRRSHSDFTPSWQGTIRTTFEHKIDDFLTRTKVIREKMEVLFKWAEKFMALARDREEIMRK